MSEKEEVVGGEAPKKKRMLSIPFLVVGVLLLACLCPVGDIDGDGSMDVAGEWVMLQVMTSQENSNVGAPVAPETFNDTDIPVRAGV